MKKILLAVTAALAITGCSQNEEFENAAQKAEINIGTIVKGTSRAAEMTNVNFGSFKVGSFIVANDFDFSTTLLGSPYMDGVEYTGKQGSSLLDNEENQCGDCSSGHGECPVRPVPTTAPELVFELQRGGCDGGCV